MNIDSKWKINKESWDKFLESFDSESDENNFKFSFKIMTKKYGQQYMEYCRASWVTCKEFMSAKDFCKMNANMPIGFFNAKIYNVIIMSIE